MFVPICSLQNWELGQLRVLFVVHVCDACSSLSVLPATVPLSLSLSPLSFSQVWRLHVARCALYFRVVPPNMAWPAFKQLGLQGGLVADPLGGWFMP